MAEGIAPEPQVTFESVRELLCCKWTMAILDAIAQGINRPGRLERSLPGLTTKVLNERIHKLERYELIYKVVYPEVPPRVEYELTERGKRFMQLVVTIRAFAEEWEAELATPSASEKEKVSGAG